MNPNILLVFKNFITTIVNSVDPSDALESMTRIGEKDVNCTRKNFVSKNKFNNI